MYWLECIKEMRHLNMNRSKYKKEKRKVKKTGKYVGGGVDTGKVGRKLINSPH